MYGMLQFMPRQGLRICANYRYSFPSLFTYTHKILEHCNNNKVIENNREYSTQIFTKYEVKSLYIINPSQFTLRNASSSSVNITQAHTKGRSRKSLYIINPSQFTLRNASSSSMEITQAHTKGRSRKWKYVLGLGGLLGGIFFYYTSEEEDVDDDDELRHSGLCTPSIPSEITKDWIEYMLTEYENRNTKGANVIINSFELNNAIKLGEGFNSQLQKLDVNASVSNLPGLGSTSLEKEYHVMIKMRDRSKAMVQEMNKFLGSELKELTLYSEVIPELNKFQKTFGNEFEIKVPGFLYGKFTNKDSVLVIQNMKPEGYKPHSVKYESDLNHAKVVVENLAKLHAVSYSYNKTHNFLDKFPCYKGEGIMNWFNSFMNTGGFLDNAIKLLELKNDPEFNKLIVKIENSKEKLDKKIRDVVRDESSKAVMCLIHGDCHNSNLLFRYGEDVEGNQVINDLQFVDWQLTNWNSPVMDLQYFISICTTHKFRKVHLETLLEHYHSAFTEATTKMGTPVTHWTYEAFKEEYDRFAVFGFIRALMIIHLVCSKFGEFYQRDMVGESSHGNSRIDRMNSKLCKGLWHKCYTNQTYAQIIIKMNAIMMYIVGREIVKGTNTVLNDRILGLVLDADEQGLFDDESL